MKATFLVDIDTGDDTDLLGIADDIRDACLERGIGVLSVKPWARPSQPISMNTPSVPGTQAAVPLNQNNQ